MPYQQLRDNFIKRNLGMGLGVARFVSCVEQAWYQTCTGEKVCTALCGTSLVPRSVETFRRHAPVERHGTKQEEEDAKFLELFAQIASRIVPASDNCPASKDSSTFPDSPVSTRAMESEATARSITMETKDGATTLRHGGWVTKINFVAATQATQHERDQQEEAKARRKALKQARHRGTHAQARQTRPVAKLASVSVEASAAPHNNSGLRRARRNAFTGGAQNKKRTRQREQRSEGAAKRQVMDSDTSSDYDANGLAFTCYVTHDDDSSMDTDRD